jgi:excisionase family DNA binding protein
MKTRRAQQKVRPVEPKVGWGKGRRRVFVEPGSATHPPPTHTIAEVAKALRKSRQTITRAIAAGQIHALPLVGEQHRVSHREFLRLTTGEPPLPE